MTPPYASQRIPEFTADGILPVGTYRVTLDAVYESVLVNGPPGSTRQTWNGSWRRRLLDNAGILVGQLRQAGITEIFLDGSFTEAKPQPNDIDGYFECDPKELGNLVRELNSLDPFKIWTWDPAERRPAKGSSKLQLPMWHRYRVEFWPHYPGLLSGIRDKFGNDLQYPAAFRQQRDTGARKGIIKVEDG